MERSKVGNFPICIFLLVAVVGCASPIDRTFRQEATPGVTFPMVFENPDAYKGETVIWGGSVIRTVNTEEGSRIFVLQTILGSRDKPEPTDTSEGRFIAVTNRLLDPLVYEKGRMITVAGKVSGKKTVVHKKTGISYTYPLVRAEQLYLWRRPKPPEPPYWGPYWGYDPFWDFSYYGGFERFEGEGPEHEGREFEGRGEEGRGEEHGFEGGRHRR